MAAHPRTYGEHKASAGAKISERGSSPHIRGTPGWGQKDTMAVRLIPAHTGNTQGMERRAVPYEAHPRTYGEHQLVVVPPHVHVGSSPHIRGTQLLIFIKINVKRLIPAHTGNTRS